MASKRIPGPGRRALPWLTALAILALLPALATPAPVYRPAKVAQPARDAWPPLATLPPPPNPADNPTTAAKVELGRMLFWDGRLSGDGKTPCVACHDPALGWGEDRAISRSDDGSRHWRNSQTVLNSGYLDRLFWDGSAASLEAQARDAAEGAVAGNGDPALMEMRLRLVPEYVERFRQVFGSQWPRLNQAYMAIAAFQRTLVSDPRKVPFDRYLNGDTGALSASALRGYELFRGKAACIQCHHGPLASDQRFHALGVPEHPLFDSDPLHQITHRWQQIQKGVDQATYRRAGQDLGLYYVTRNAKDIGKFRTPPLRELKSTAPYMHNGIFATLAEVIDFYAEGGGRHGPHKSVFIWRLSLDAQERRDLVAFLESLSMDEPLRMQPPTLPPYEALKAPP